MLSRENPPLREHYNSAAAKIWRIAGMEAKLYRSKSFLGWEVWALVEENDWYPW